MMSHHAIRSTVAIIVAACVPAVSAGEKVEFNRHVRPILSNHCFQCHGPDVNTPEAGLRLDVRDAAVAVLGSGVTAIVPGDVSASAIVSRITSPDPQRRMPPADGHKALAAAQIDTLKKWIEQGAEYEPHWAFVGPKRPEIPKVSQPEWPRNEIDHFVMSNLDRKGKKAAREASHETLIRRVAFDLTGLPPTLAAIDQFLNDEKPKAYERMVDRYLASPAYGEHLARHWLDLARYADSNGYQYDTERQQWVWRDWVISAYNENMPFDQFTIEQLAGDLLPNASPQQRLATGFNRNHGITIEGGIIDEEYRTEYVMDRLVTSGAVWLGMTIGCARCHDHKFDPISQKEFYQLYAFFNQVPERGMRGFAPQEKIASPLAATRNAQIDAEIAKLKAELSKPAELEKALAAWSEQVASVDGSWKILKPLAVKSTGGSTLTQLDDASVLVGGRNPQQDIYEITAKTNATELTAVRLEALTHSSLPGGGPGRYSNSNFVLSEFELEVVSTQDLSQSQQVKFTLAIADYSQDNYHVAKAIDGAVAGTNGWAVDGPSRKQPATALFVAGKPFGFDGGSELRFRLRHQSKWGSHGVGRTRLSVTSAPPNTLRLGGVATEIQHIAATPTTERTATEKKQLRDYFLTHHHVHKPLQERLATLQKQKSGGFPATMIMRNLSKPRATYILNRGQYNEPTKQVTAAVPEIFPPLPEGAPPNRLGLAQSLVDLRHPLTARVAVNRHWQRLFGLGLVETSEDFGLRGELPSHPDLLDWLAIEFIEGGWDIKRLQRLILTSATYRQSSQVGNAAYNADPENRLLARGPRMRLEGEEIRDAALAISGLLVRRLGGPSVYPYQPKGLWLELNNRPGYSKTYPVGSGDDLYRRSLYTFWKRTVPSPMLKTFDAPAREFCTIRRSRTNTPLQALLLLNGPQFVEAARHLGRRMLTADGDSADERIVYGFRLVTARQPSDAELAVLREAYEAGLENYHRDETARGQLLEVGASPLDPHVNQAELAAWVNVARLLLNLDEAITKG